MPTGPVFQQVTYPFFSHLRNLVKSIVKLFVGVVTEGYMSHGHPLPDNGGLSRKINGKDGSKAQACNWNGTGYREATKNRDVLHYLQLCSVTASWLPVLVREVQKVCPGLIFVEASVIPLRALSSLVSSFELQ